MVFPADLRRRALIAAACCLPLAARARSSPVMRLVVPFTAGGSSDLLAQAIGPKLSQALGHAVIVDHKPGAGGTLAAAEAARAAPDGFTLFMGHTGTLAVNPAIYPKLHYDPQESFQPVALLARVPNVLVVPANFPARTLKDFIALAHADPGRYAFSSGGNGSAAHITFEYLKLRAKISLLHIPYRGTAPSVTDVLAGQIHCTFTGTPAVIAHIRSGRLRPLAVSSTRRIPVLPEVPTVAESGFPGFEADQWYGLVAPAGTPLGTVRRLNTEINRVLTLPGVAQQMAVEGVVPTPTTPQAFAELIAREIPHWAEVARAGKVRLD